MTCALPREQETRSEFDRDLVALKTQIQAYITARPYDYLIYVPIRKDYQACHSSPDDLKFQKAVDTEFRRLLADLQLSFTELKDLDSMSRLEEVMRLLRKKYHFGSYRR